jgi:hypothetical protein
MDVLLEDTFGGTRSVQPVTVGNPEGDGRGSVSGGLMHGGNYADNHTPGNAWPIFNNVADGGHLVAAYPGIESVKHCRPATFATVTANCADSRY